MSPINRITPYKISKNGKHIDPWVVYCDYRTSTVNSGEQNPIVKTFVFPQLNKQSFVIGLYNQTTRLDTINWDKWWLWKFSINTYSDKDAKNLFTSQALVFGRRWQKYFTSAYEIPSRQWFMFMPYFKTILVDIRKFKEQVKQVLSEPNLKPFTFAIGSEFAFGASNKTFFRNMNYILNNYNNLSSPEIKGFVYSGGVRALFSSNEFNLSH